MNRQREYYKVWKVAAAEMDFFDFDKKGPKTEKTYTHFTNFVKSHIEKAINGKSPYIEDINDGGRIELPDNWWEVAIGIHDGKKVIPNVEEDDKSEVEETPAQILRGIAKGYAGNEDVYNALLPVYTALRENYDSRFKLFSWIFDHARYTAERDSMKALSGMIQALTGDSKEELDRRYRELKAEVQLTPEQKKKLNEKVKIDKLKISNPEKAEKLIAKQKMLDEQKKQNKVDEYGGYSNLPQEEDYEEEDDYEIEEEENSLNENREQMKDEQFIKDVAIDDNQSEVSNMIDENNDLNKSSMINSMD